MNMICPIKYIFRNIVYGMGVRAIQRSANLILMSQSSIQNFASQQDKGNKSVNSLHKYKRYEGIYLQYSRSLFRLCSCCTWFVSQYFKYLKVSSISSLSWVAEVLLMKIIYYSDLNACTVPEQHSNVWAAHKLIHLFLKVKTFETKFD